MSNYEQMSIEELEAAIAALTEEQYQLKQQKLAAHAVLDTKAQAAAAQRKVAALSEGEKSALLQELRAHGISSEESFGQM